MVCGVPPLFGKTKYQCRESGNSWKLPLSPRYDLNLQVLPARLWYSPFHGCSRDNIPFPPDRPTIRAFQVSVKPADQVTITGSSIGDTDKHAYNFLVNGNEHIMGITAIIHQLQYQVQCCSLVAINEAMTSYDSMYLG